MASGVSKGGGGGAQGARTPPSALPQQPGQYSSVATIFTDNRQLVARTNNELIYSPLKFPL